MRSPVALLMMLLLAVVLAGCSTTGKRGGGYYKDDGPDANPPANLDSIPDAVPRLEPLASGANRPYVVFGKRYVPDLTEQPFRQEGVASWYGKKFHGNSTSIGEPYDMYSMTAAHPTMPIPSYARVTSKVNGRTIIVRVNDRGPFHSDRIMDLSYVAAHKLGIIGPGSGAVVVERILPTEIRSMLASGSATPAVSGLEPVALADLPAATPTPLPLPDAAPRAPATARRAAAGGVYLQLGAFSQAANAQSVVSKVNGLMTGEPAATVEQGSQLYRVRMGPYASREAALEAVRRVSDRTGILPSLAAQ
ncbi:septal ring lytic transglycosylase RlpA family protein [Bordetella genomosp. 12]|uniref:Endolytic peptidoglycan transglycosylase RlpA n=1 Tax=Bordetella genomosp. 12 TaxID=463035 RepID=A0A261VTB1_9BORD|nr:septal ring lytic transglycosylase RlpA family protein [Bordetella genomosp. 12]OZI77348.1 septal ring lytic transglycosylase RlpA family lipoprotein [Bordetella genomosp. 12]